MKLERREIIKTSPLIVSADCLKPFPGRGAGRRTETEPSSPTELRSRDEREGRLARICKAGCSWGEMERRD